MATRIVLNRKGVEHYLKVESVKALMPAGKRIEQAADAASGEDDHETQLWIGRNRARVTVRTKTPRGRWFEAKQRTLNAALDAGRD